MKIEPNQITSICLHCRSHAYDCVLESPIRRMRPEPMFHKHAAAYKGMVFNEIVWYDEDGKIECKGFICNVKDL